MEIARDSSEYPIAECLAVFNANNGVLRFPEHWIRMGTSHYRANLIIDGKNMEISITYKNTGGHLRTESKSFRDTGFDVLADIDRLWLIIHDFITIVCESEMIFSKRSIEDQEDFALIAKFLKAANYYAGIVPEHEKNMELSKFVEPYPILDFDGVDVHNFIYNRNGRLRKYVLTANRIIKYGNNWREVEIDASGEIELCEWNYIEKEQEDSRVCVGYNGRN